MSSSAGDNVFAALIGLRPTWSRDERLAELRRLCGWMMARDDRGFRWLGQGLERWTREGGDLAAVLQLRGPRGSRATPWNRARQAEVDALLLRLATLAGTDAKACAWLTGTCINAAKVVVAYYTSKLTGQAVQWGLPISIAIEPTTSCNLRCPECPSGKREFTRPTGMLSHDFFRKTIDSLYKNI